VDWKKIGNEVFLLGVSAGNNMTTSEIKEQMAEGLCHFKTLMRGVLPTLAIISLFFAACITLFAVALMKMWISHYNKKNPEAKLRLREFLRLPLEMKIVGAFFALLIISLLESFAVAIILAILTPAMIETISGVAIPANC